MFNSDNKQQSEKKTALDVCMKLLSLEKKNGYVYDDKSFPNIPEIMVQAVPVVKEFLARFLIEPNPNPSLMCAWACYAGMGAVWKWDEDWDALKQNGIFATLVTPRGLDEMDEFVTDGIGWKFGSKKSDDLPAGWCFLFIRNRHFLFDRKRNHCIKYWPCFRNE